MIPNRYALFSLGFIFAFLVYSEAVLLAVLGGSATSHLIQAWSGTIFRAHIRGWKALAHRAEWLAGVFGFVTVQAAVAGSIQPMGGHIAAAGAQFLLLVAFWWWSLHCLLAGQVPWRRLFIAGVATAVCCTGLGVYIACLASSSLVSNEASYGPFGAVMTLLTAEIGLGVALHLGAVIGATIGRGKDQAAAARADPGHQVTKDGCQGSSRAHLAPSRRQLAGIGRMTHRRAARAVASDRFPLRSRRQGEHGGDAHWRGMPATAVRRE